MSAPFRLRRVRLEPGTEQEFRADEWQDCLVLVDGGPLEVECASGTRALFEPGAALTFVGLSLRSLRCAGIAPVVLTALSRNFVADR